jgi:hypothetical protein
MQATPIDELRKPHPDQKQIDAEAAELLKTAALTGYAKKRQPREGMVHAIRLLDRSRFQR